MEELLPKVLDLARKLNAAEACAIWRHEPDTTSGKSPRPLGLSSAYQDVAIHSQSGIIGERPFCFEDVNQVPPEAGRRALYEAEGIRSLVAMPMKIGGRISGTLAFYYHEPHRFLRDRAAGRRRADQPRRLGRRNRRTPSGTGAGARAERVPGGGQRGAGLVARL